MEKAIISFKNILKTFGDQIILDSLSFDIHEREFVTLLGPSGCGKTTILRLIAGFEQETSGQIYIDGKMTKDTLPSERNVNTIFQNYALFPHMNVYDNIAFSLKIKKIPKTIIYKKVFDLLKLVKLDGFEKIKIHTLSGGQKQRVAIARALINEPLVLLLDEPLNALDYKLRKEMQLELKHLQKKLGITFIFVTHDQEEAIAMSERIIVMNNGKIEQDGTPKDIYEEPANLFVAKFVGEINLFGGVVQGNQGDEYDIKIYDKIFRISCKKALEYREKVTILLRPEDLFILQDDQQNNVRVLKGKVSEMIYKGTTVDVFVKLVDGKTIMVTEFFNEDAEDIYYQRDENVSITWLKGWEVILKEDENIII